MAIEGTASMGAKRARWWLAALLLAAGCAAATVPATGPAIGDVPPPLLGKDRDGNEVDLAQLRGKVVVVSFWAAWCGFCLKELPALNEIQTRAGEDFLRIVAVNVKDDTAQYRTITRQMRDYTLTLTRDRDGRIADGYGIRTYPNLWIIDPEGRVASRHTGYGDDSFRKIVDEIRRVLYEGAERARGKAPAAGATGGHGSG